MRSEPTMKTAIAMRVTAVKRITVAVLGWLCIAAWFGAVLHFLFTMEF